MKQKTSESLGKKEMVPKPRVKVVAPRTVVHKKVTELPKLKEEQIRTPLIEKASKTDLTEKEINDFFE